MGWLSVDHIFARNHFAKRKRPPAPLLILKCVQGVGQARFYFGVTIRLAHSRRLRGGTTNKAAMA
jgi:hypothetical protein